MVPTPAQLAHLQKKASGKDDSGGGGGGGGGGDGDGGGGGGSRCFESYANTPIYLQYKHTDMN